ncbi:sensor histidine kinase [Ancylomarina sp. 16SWW S1-10-2]|uniref:sensor histidine kinase n=1 Tax=Ancylomarina sp. 16SWW S1-10-2 TaxID=2499681 RepID=UPI0012AD924F|nr:sensor histidine kinase [Ancylomarina sp. 16SWW S1-10-2]MRT93533.1 sensor histidine kinase [Ancylomarina sp. 16SWW S1-10-2]
MNLLKKIYLVSLFLSIQFLANAEDKQFINYNFDSDQNPSYIYCLSQDSIGNLWIGTSNGLVKYDGYNFRSYTINDSLGENFITCSLKGKNGMWFGHMNGVLTFYDGTTFKPIELHADKKSKIADLEKDEYNDIFAINQAGELFLANHNSVNKLPIQDTFPPINAIKVIDDQQMLLGTQNGIHLIAYRTGKTLNVEAFSSLQNFSIVDIEKCRHQNGFWLLTKDNGIYKILHQKGQWQVVKILEDTMPQKAQCFIEDKQANLWVSSINSGLYKYVPSKGDKYLIDEQFSIKDGLRSNQIKTVFEDQRGHIWLGEYGGGLSRFFSEAFSILKFNEKKYGDNITALNLNVDSDWIGTNRGVIQVDALTNKVLKFINLNFRDPNDKVRSIYFDKNNDLWIGTENSGLLLLRSQSGKLIDINLREGKLENSITKIVGQGDVLWIATKKGVCSLNTKTKERFWYTMNETGLPHNCINDLHIDKKGRVWIAAITGSICYILDQKVHKINISDDGSLIQIVSITDDDSGAIWFGTQGNGIYRFENDSILNFTSQNGLLSNYCYSIINDLKGRLWVTHKGGLSRISVDNFNIKPIKEIGVKTKLSFNENTSGIDSYSNIWFGSEEGILKYNLQKEVAQNLPLKLQITSVSVNGEIVKPVGPLKLKANKYKLKINFKGFDLTAANLIKYQYKLDGFDAYWSDFTSNRQAEYKQLGPGEYHFMLKAVDAEGYMLKKAVNLDIDISYPIWQRQWFLIMSIVLLIVFVYMYIKYREVNLKRIQKGLMVNLDEKSREIIAKEEIIKERKRNEKALISAKEKAEESDRLKSAFLSNMSHEVRTPLNAIIGFSKLITSPDINEEIKPEFCSIIESNVSDLLHLVDDIMDFSIIEAGQLNLDFIDCELSTIFKELYKIYEVKLMGDPEKDIELICNYPDQKYYIKTDEYRLKQIINNFLSNAIKFTEKGQIEFGYIINDDKQVTIFVKDTGIGIAEDKFEGIFKRFQKGFGKESKTLYRGAGLGLAISKNLIESLGGKIWFTSELNKGSNFYITLNPTLANKIKE